MIDRFQLKLLAAALMTLCHIGSALLPGTAAEMLLSAIGFGAAPVFIFLIVEGYFYSSKWIWYLFRLWLLGALSQLPYAYLFGTADNEKWAEDAVMAMISTRFNMLFTLALCLLAVVVWDRVRNRFLRGCCWIMLFLLGELCDWNMLAVPLTLLLCSALRPELRADRPKASDRCTLKGDSGKADRNIYADGASDGTERKGLAAFYNMTALKNAVVVFILYYIYIGTIDKMTGGMVFGSAFLWALADSGMPVFVAWLIRTRYDGTLPGSRKMLCQWGFYFYYPLHLGIIALIRMLMMS